jgi:hypothetical protein
VRSLALSRGDLAWMTSELGSAITLFRFRRPRSVNVILDGLALALLTVCDRKV